MNLHSDVLRLIPWLANYKNSEQGRKPQGFSEWMKQKLEEFREFVVGMFVWLLAALEDLKEMLNEVLNKILMNLFKWLAYLLWLIIRAALLVLAYVLLAITIAGLILAYSVLIFISQIFQNTQCGFFSMEMNLGGITSLVSQKIGWHYNKFFDLEFPYIETKIELVKSNGNFNLLLEMGLIDGYFLFDYSSTSIETSGGSGISTSSDEVFKNPDFTPELGLIDSKFDFEVEYTGSVMPDEVILKMRAPDPKNNFDEELKTDGNSQELLDKGKITYYLEDKIQLKEVGKWKYFIEANYEEEPSEESEEDWGPEIVGTLESYIGMLFYFAGCGVGIITIMGQAGRLRDDIDIIVTLAALVTGFTLLHAPCAIYELEDANNDEVISFFGFKHVVGAIRLAAIFYCIMMVVANIVGLILKAFFGDYWKLFSFCSHLLSDLIMALMVFMIPDIDELILYSQANYIAYQSLYIAAGTAWHTAIDTEGFGIIGLFAYSLVHIMAIFKYILYFPI